MSRPNLKGEIAILPKLSEIIFEDIDPQHVTWELVAEGKITGLYDINAFAASLTDEGVLIFKRRDPRDFLLQVLYLRYSSKLDTLQRMVRLEPQGKSMMKQVGDDIAEKIILKSPIEIKLTYK